MAGVVRTWYVVPASTPSPLVTDISRTSVCHCPSLRASEVNAATSDGWLAIVVPHHQRVHPRLRARLDREDQLVADAQQRGWQLEVERHQATKRRLEQLLHDLA
jgi:hypothetical protein